jgi:hypothetical protein
MNYANLQQAEITLDGKGRNELSCPVPSWLLQHLIPKRIAVQDFYMTMGSIPKFIPRIATAETIAYGLGNAGATGSNESNSSMVPINQTDYFINCRDSTNTNCFTAYIEWTNPNDAQTPIGQYTQADCEISPYFLCFNLMNFVSMIQTALNLAVTNIVGGPLSSPCAFTYDVESDTFNISIPQTYDAYSIELSPSLKRLFNFETTLVRLGTIYTHKIIWSPILISINDVDCVNSACKGSTSLFPYDRLILTTNLPITPTTFLDNSMTNFSQASDDLNVLFMLRRFDERIGVDVSVSDENTNMIERARTFIQEKHTDSMLSFRILLRSKATKNFIEWALPPGEKIELTLNTYNLL